MRILVLLRQSSSKCKGSKVTSFLTSANHKSSSEAEKTEKGANIPHQLCPRTKVCVCQYKGSCFMHVTFDPCNSEEGNLECRLCMNYEQVNDLSLRASLNHCDQDSASVFYSSLHLLLFNIPHQGFQCRNYRLHFRQLGLKFLTTEAIGNFFSHGLVNFQEQ